MYIRNVDLVIPKKFLCLRRDSRCQKKIYIYKNCHKRSIENTLKYHGDRQFNSSIAFLQGLLVEVASLRRDGLTLDRVLGLSTVRLHITHPRTYRASALATYYGPLHAERYFAPPLYVRAADAHVSPECQTFRQPFTRRRRRSIKLRTIIHMQCNHVNALCTPVFRVKRDTYIGFVRLCRPWDINTSM